MRGVAIQATARAARDARAGHALAALVGIHTRAALSDRAVIVADRKRRAISVGDQQTMPIRTAIGLEEAADGYAHAVGLRLRQRKVVAAFRCRALRARVADLPANHGACALQRRR